MTQNSSSRTYYIVSRFILFLHCKRANIIDMKEIGWLCRQSTFHSILPLYLFPVGIITGYGHIVKIWKKLVGNILGQ